MHFLVIIIALILLGAFWPLILRGALIVGGLTVAGGVLFAVLYGIVLTIGAVWPQPRAGTEATTNITPLRDPRYPPQATVAPLARGATFYDPVGDDPDKPLPADLVRPGCVKLLDTMTKPDCYQIRSR